VRGDACESCGDQGDMGGVLGVSKEENVVLVEGVMGWEKLTDSSTVVQAI
jgi:ribosomal protein L24